MYLDTYVLLEENGLDGVVKGRDIDEVISFLIKTKSFVFKLGWEGVLDKIGEDAFVVGFFIYKIWLFDMEIFYRFIWFSSINMCSW